MRNRNKKNTSYVEDNNTNIYAKFQLHPPYDFSEDFWIRFFGNWTFRLPWQAIKINNLDKIHMVCRGLLQEHFCKTFAKISAMRSHCKSNENLSCHSNPSAWATAIKNNIFVEAIVRNNSAKFQLYLPVDFTNSNFMIITALFLVYEFKFYDNYGIFSGIRIQILWLLRHCFWCMNFFNKG